MTTIIKGVISSDLTLNAGEYWIDGLVQVAPTVTLTLSAGSIINGEKGTSKLLVAGNLISTGTLNDPVILDGVATEFSDSKGSAVTFSVFKNCNSALFLNGDSPVPISDSLFINNSIAITDYGGYQYMDINKCTFSNNGSVFSGIRTRGADFSNNQFSNNKNVFEYGYYVGDVIVSNNNFESNDFVIKAPETGYGYGTVSMQGNWWGTTNSSLIDSLIYDQLDLVTLQKINYLPSLNEPNSVGVEFTNSEPTGTVTITGTISLNKTLTVANNLADANGLGTISYQWQANDVYIGTGNSYTLTSNEVSKTIKVIANYTDGLGNAESVTSAVTTAVTEPTNGLPIGNVKITGIAKQNEVLTASNTLADADGLGTVTYSWLADGLSIGTGNTYTVTADEIGKTLAVTGDIVKSGVWSI